MINSLEAAAYLQSRGIDKAEIGIVLGTGLGQAFINEMDVITTIHYRNIPHFPSSTVQSHKGQLVFGKLGKKKVLVMQGRVHYYEGYSMDQITFPVQVMKELGVKSLFVTNAAGNLNMEWHKGDIMLITDHINYQPRNPLLGKRINGEQEHGAYEPLSRTYKTLARAVAKRNKVQLREGVYVAVQGPTLETRAEYKLFRFIGGDAVGMSTVPEVMVAHRLGMKVCGFSILTNDCDPDNLHKVALTEIVDTATKAEEQLTKLLAAICREL